MGKLPLVLNIFSTKTFQQRFGVTTNFCREIIARKDEHVFTFPKTMLKDGKLKTRVLTSPTEDYKTALRRINKTMTKATNWDKWSGVCGSVPKKTLDDMTNPHCKQQCFIKMDLKDFFPSITVDRVKRVLINTNLHKDIANLLAEFVTLDGVLPQGFPTSPIISNLVAYNLDVQQTNICKKLNLKRTRWIDDIVISGTTKDVHKATGKLKKSIEKNGFVLHPDKFQTMYRGSAKEKPNAVGLMLDKNNPYLSDYEIEAIKKLFYICFDDGVEEGEAHYYNTTLKRPKSCGMKAVLKGKLEYLKKYASDEVEELEGLLQAMLSFQ